jgi:sugar lactone lactonase YvrE
MHQSPPTPDLSFIGSGLKRPECVVTHASGWLFAADWTASGGVSAIAPDGRVGRVLARGGVELRPNGIALEASGSFLIAHLGATEGGLFRLHGDGRVEPVLREVHGVLLPPCNFPLIDRAGRIWLTVSTRVTPRADDYRASANTGFIVLLDQTGARIVADGLGYANECVLSADETTLYINETFARRLTAFSVAADGSLSDRRTVAHFGAGEFPDGVARDALDHLWVTSIVSNRVLRVSPAGVVTEVLADSNAAHTDWVEAAYRANRLGREHLDGTPCRLLPNLSSLAFGGPAGSTAYLGTLLGDRIARFDAGVRGASHTHFNTDRPRAFTTDVLP